MKAWHRGCVPSRPSAAHMGQLSKATRGGVGGHHLDRIVICGRTSVLHACRLVGCGIVGPWDRVQRHFCTRLLDQTPDQVHSQWVAVAATACSMRVCG